MTQLSSLCESLGHALTPAELETAHANLDADNSGEVDMEEFVKWWEGHDDYYSEL
jgi:Ca2+-binding EF-hand superfamily protein